MNNWDIFWLSENINSFSMRLHHKIIFKVYKSFLDFLNLKKPSIIELGCGSGELTARILKNYGGSATLVDKSREALKVAKRNFRKQNLKANFVYENLFDFKPKKKFDIVHSEGLIEHFKEKEQKKVLEVHKNCVKGNGFIIISVPRRTWYYRIWRFYLEKRKRWHFGFEYPIDKIHLKNKMEKIGLKVLKNIDYFRYSFALAKK